MNAKIFINKVLLILCINHKQMLLKADCGLPAIPDSTKLSIFRSRYEEQTIITYECDNKNSQLIEGKYRKCINHKWNGSLPRCATEVRKAVLKSIFIEESGKHRPIYRQIIARSTYSKPHQNSMNKSDNFECAKTKYLWDIYGNQTWVFQLTRGYYFNYFILYMKGGSLLENQNDNNLNLEAGIQDIVSSKSCEIENFSLMDDAITYKIGFICSPSLKPIALHEGIDESVQELIIRVDTQKINVTTIFCALKLYSISDSCGSPEKPLNSHLLAREKTYSVFSCREGYYIEGIQKVKCGPNGKWMNEFPLCKPNKTCVIPAIDREDPYLLIQYKNVYKVNGVSYGEPDGIAIYACINQTDGSSMQFKGESTRICKDGKWTGKQPICQHLTDMNLSQISYHFEPELKSPQSNQSLNKVYIVIIAMLGSFTVGGISVAIIIYLVIKRRENCRKRPKISIIIDESEDIDYDRPQEYSSVRVSQCSNISNEVINPLYEDLKKFGTPLNIPVESVDSMASLQSN